jgi:hypothetical protein
MRMDNKSVARALFSGAGEVKVSGRPEPVPVDLRRSWRIAIVVLALASSRASRASREKLLLLNYALRNPSTQDTFLDVLNGAQSPLFLEVRVDPPLARAVDFAVGLGLVTWDGASGLALTHAGEELAGGLNADDTILSTEKQFLARTRHLATETRLREVLRWR